MANLLVDLQAYIIGLGYATEDGIDIFRDMLPDDPDDAITLYEYFGEPFGNNVEGMLRMVQVLVRRKTYADARALSWSLYSAFHKPNDSYIFTLGGRNALIRVKNTPFKMQADNVGRNSYTFNMGITTRLD